MRKAALSVKELYSGEQTAARQPRIIGREDRINFGGEQVSKVQLLEASKRQAAAKMVLLKQSATLSCLSVRFLPP